MMAEMLEKYTDKKVEIELVTGEKITCRPLQQLEEEYESFLIKLEEPWEGYSKGQLMEIAYNQVLKVKKL